MTAAFSDELVIRICRDAASATNGPTVLDTVRDPLDDSVWVCLSSWSCAQEARRALAEFGLASCEGHDARLHVTGWDRRLLRRRLAVVLAGVDDLTVEWDATVELANYCYDRRAAVCDEPDLADVLVDVESTMRRAIPLPHRAPNVNDVEDLLQLVEVAEDAYERLIGEHVDHAERALAGRRAVGAA